MKRKLLFATILSFTLLSSCIDDKKETADNLTIDNLIKINDLFSFGEIQRGNFTSKSNYFKYSIVLDALNKTNNTFEKTIVEADLKLILQNNNVLSAKDTDKVLNLGSIEKITFWKPNQTKVIGNNKELYTQSLPNHFKEYPVKQVVLVLKLTASDIVNKTEETIVHNIDITEDWKIFLSQKGNIVTKEQKKSFQNESLIPKEKVKAVTQPVKEQPKTQKVSDFIRNASSSLNNGNKSGGDGSDNVAGNKGKLNGSLSSNNYYGDESREVNSSIVGRQAISRPSPQNTCNEAGVVVVKVTVNRKGEVIDALAGIKGTTTQSECLLKISKEAALKTKWKSSEEAHDEQVVSITYNFKLR